MSNEAHPDLIVTSSLRRTKQIAQPALVLFRSVPREVWAVHEFTYLGLQHDTLSTIKERLALVKDYWEQCEPSAIDSPDSESFLSFIMRVADLLFHLREMSYPTIAIFSHEQFICAFLWWLQRGRLNLSQDDMKDYREFFHANHIPNGGIVRVQFDDDYAGWQYEVITSHMHGSEALLPEEDEVGDDEIELTNSLFSKTQTRSTSAVAPASQVMCDRAVGSTAYYDCAPSDGTIRAAARSQYSQRGFARASD